MALVYWTQDLNTGFADVDEQHQILVDHFNKLDDAFKSADYEATKKELQDLIDYTIFHFGEEEKMLEAAHYRMTEPHKKVHANFIKKMGELQGRFENGDITALQEVLDMCDGWLFRHIRLNDHGYIADVKAAGVRSTPQHKKRFAIIAKRFFICALPFSGCLLCLTEAA